MKIDLQQLVPDKLDEIFGKFELYNVKDYLEQVEDATKSIVFEVLNIELKNIANELKKNFTTSKYGFHLDKEYFYIYLTLERDVLKIEIEDKNKSVRNRNISWERIPLESDGKIRSIKLRITERFNSYLERIANVVALTLESLYRWLREQIISTFSRIREDASLALYTKIRQRLPRSVSRYIWLAVHCDGQTNYIFDTRTQIDTLDQAKILTNGHPISPIEILTEIASATLPLEQTHAANAFKQQKAVLQDLTDKKYEFSIRNAETIVYDANIIWVQPMLKEGKTWLTASYPKELRESVEPILNHLKTEFKKIVTQNAIIFHRISKELNRIDFSKESLQKILRGLGSFMGGIFGIPTV